MNWPHTVHNTRESPRYTFTIIIFLIFLIKKIFFLFKVLSVQFSSVQSLSHVQLFAAPWTSACQACLSITNSQSLSKFMSIESVMGLRVFLNYLISPHPLPPTRHASPCNILLLHLCPGGHRRQWRCAGRELSRWCSSGLYPQALLREES